MAPTRDPSYDAWLERNAYVTTLIYSAFIGVLLPVFHYVLQSQHVTDSLPLRFVCTGCAAAVAAVLLFVPASRRYAQYLQFAQVIVTVAVIDILVVDSGDQYLYIASALLVIIGEQNAYFDTRLLAVTMSLGFVFMVAYCGVRGILWEPYNLTTLAIFFSGYALAFIPASIHIGSRESDIRSRLQALRATRELESLARFDPLTGLPNRSVLQEQLRETLDRMEKTGGRCAVLFLDLDRFKDINDTLGHSVGDLLLKEVAQRIRGLLPAGTLVTRWGGDEFVAVIGNVQGEAAVARMCRNVIEGLSQPFTVESYELAVTASAGVTLFPKDGADPEVLIRNADTAMYEAKAVRAERYALFAPEMHAIAARRHRVQNELQIAVASASLSLQYQPINGAASGLISGAEALLRWRDSDGRLHSPLDFIPIAEDTGAIVPIGMWVIEQAAKQAKRWEMRGWPLSIAVNISPRQLTHADFLQSLARIVAETGVEPGRFEIEITESGLVPNAASVMRVLEMIQAMGLRIAVDDFGTGYSAFSYLKQLPLNTLKIDRVFVEGIERDVDRSIVESIVAVAHKIELSVTAEGVETPLQRAILSDIGCDRLQGYGICPPLSADAFEEFAALSLSAV